jgi:ribosome biogenesis GTPase / thiamine phosphate phosphatase
MLNNSLKKLWGFHPMQEAYYNALKEEYTNLLPARVTFSSHELFRVMIIGINEERQAKVRGDFYHRHDELPVVGDWVGIDFLPGDHESLPIECVLPRVSALRRADETLFANADHIGLVTSFNDDLNERRLERGLMMIEESGAEPVIILNKMDLVDYETIQSMLDQLAERFSGVTICACSAQTYEGMNELMSFFAEGTSVAFLGMSGVGKSTLVNSILESQELKTSGIRESDSRGRHTTTHRELLHTEKGFWVIDTPGIREFSIAASEDALDRTFDDIVQLGVACRFGDCAHDSEPGCRVQRALENGELSYDRWKNYLKLKREMEFQLNKNNKAYQSAKKKEYAKISRLLKQKKKF